MPRIIILPDQSNTIADTLSAKSSYTLIMRAFDATPVFWSQSRGDLDGNIDQGGNPTGGMPMFQTDPPVVLIGVRALIWGRAGTKTFVYVELIETNLGVYVAQRDAKAPPPQGRYVRPQGPLPNYDEALIGGRPR